MWGHFCRHKLAERPEQDIATWLKTRPPWKPCWNMLQTLAILNNLKTFLNNEQPKDPMDKVRIHNPRQTDRPDRPDRRERYPENIF